MKQGFSTLKSATTLQGLAPLLSHATGNSPGAVLASLSQLCPLVLWGIFYVYGRFSIPAFYHFFLVGLPAYFSNHSPFLREHIFVGFNEFPSLVCWCTVIHHHLPQGPTLFRIVRWDFTCVQCYVYTDTGPPVSSPI